MDELHQKIIDALRQGLGDVVDALDDVEETERITGVVVSSAFNDMGYRRRQKRLWGVLEKSLTPEELEHVGPIAALTPAEATVKA